MTPSFAPRTLVAMNWSCASAVRAHAGLSLLLLLPSCNLFFTETSSDAAGTIDSTNLLRVQLRFIVDEIRNDAQGLPIVKRMPRDLANWKVSVRIADGAPIDAVVDATTGIATFERPSVSTPYTVFVQQPGQPEFVFEGVAAEHFEVVAHYGRLDAAPAATRRITLIAAQPDTQFAVATTGTYATLSLPACSNNCDWQLARPFEELRLPNSTFGDRVYGLLYGPDAMNFSVLRGTAVENWDLETNQAVAFNTQLQQPNPTEYDVALAMQQMCNMLPASAVEHGSWQLRAVPTPFDENGQPVVVPPEGHPIAMFPKLNTAAPPGSCAEPATQKFKTTNPFPRTNIVLHREAVNPNGYKSGAALPTLLHESIVVDSLADGATTSFQTPLNGPNVRSVTLNDVVVVPKPTFDTLPAGYPLELKWSTASAIAADFFVVKLHRLYADGTNSRTRVEATFRTTEGKLTIPAAYATVGEFILSIDARLGYPNAKQQDFRTRQYPFWSSELIVANVRLQ